MYRIERIEGTYFLLKNGRIIESYDTKQEAEFALFDLTKGWESFSDREKRNRK